MTNKLFLRKGDPAALISLHVIVQSWPGESLKVSVWLTEHLLLRVVAAHSEPEGWQMLAPYGFRSESFYPCYGMAESTLIISGGSQLMSPNVLHLDAIALENNQVEPVQKSESSVEHYSLGKALSGKKLRS